MNAVVSSNRGTGKTTRAMVAAPKNAVFVWINDHLEYPKSLAKYLGRDDLNIVGPSWLAERRWVGLTLYGLVCDPDSAMFFNEELHYMYQLAKLRVRT